MSPQYTGMSRSFYARKQQCMVVRVSYPSTCTTGVRVPETTSTQSTGAGSTYYYDCDGKSLGTRLPQIPDGGEV